MRKKEKKNGGGVVSFLKFQSFFFFNLDMRKPYTNHDFVIVDYVLYMWWWGFQRQQTYEYARRSLKAYKRKKTKKMPHGTYRLIIELLHWSLKSQ